MKFTLEDISSVKKTLHIEIPKDEVIKEVEHAYKELNRTAKVKGFRPGKVPRSILERLHGKDVTADITSHLIQTSFAEALKESGLSPLLNPDIDPPQLDTETDYKYSATIEIRPEIPDVDFKGLSLRRILYKPTDQEIEAQIKVLQSTMADRKTIEPARPAVDGDFAILDYEGFKDGKPHPEIKKTENFSLKIGLATISKEFDESIKGLMPGDEKTFTITFPADHRNAGLASQEVEFMVKLRDIREEILPELNDDFAEKLGPFATIEDVKTAIRGNLENGYKKRTDQEISEQIFSALIAKTPFEVPETMIDWELAGIIREIERSFEHREITLESVGMNRENLAITYRGTAEKQAKRHLILGKIVLQEKLTLSDEELQNAFQNMAVAYGSPVYEIKSHFEKNPSELDLFKHTLLEKHAMTLIIESNHVEDVEPVLENSKTDQID